VKDQGFQHLMKTGRPDYYIPSPTTVSQDVKRVFANVQKYIAKMLQEHDGKLNFATDTWTLPNHKAFITVTAHFEVNGEPVCYVVGFGRGSDVAFQRESGHGICPNP
jgi:hypothetical protein